MDFQINLKNFMRQIKEWLQFIKTIESELTFQYCYLRSSIPKEEQPTHPYTAQSQLC